MAAKNPIRGDYSGSDLVGFAEFQASDFIAIADGGTGAITAAGARTALGLVIGSDVQSYDAQLTDISNLTPTDSGFIVGDGSNFVLETGNTARASLGLSTSDSPQFTGLTLTTLSLDSVTLSAVITESEGMSGSDNDTSIPTTAAIIDYVAGQVQNEESIEDFVGGMVTGNTETFITVTYEDSDGTMDFVVPVLDEDDFASNSATHLATQQSIKAYVDAIDVDDDLTVSDGSTSSTVNLDSDTLTIQGTANEVEISNSSNTFTVGLPNNVTVGNNLTVTGNLTVSGTTTTVNTETVTIADNQILLNSDYSGSAPTANAGIEVNRGGGSAPNKTLVWNETDDKWTVGSETFVAGTFEGALTGNVTGNVTGTVSSIANHDTDSLSEGSSNLYYTNTRFDTRLATKDTDNLTEGSSNLYYTDTRTRSAVSVASGSGLTYNSSTGEFGTSSIANTQLANSSISINSNSVALGGSVSLDTDDITEGSSNLYYTTGRFDTRLATKDTDDLSEGTTNLYFTNERVDDRVNALLTAGSNITLTYDDASNTLTIAGVEDNFSNNTTDDLSEGSSNLYYTDARVESYLSGGTGIDFSSGAISIDSTVVTESSTDTLTNKTINFEDNTAIIEFAVTVSNASGSNKYFLDGEASASVKLIPGVTYRFNQSDNSNSGHPFAFSTSEDGTSYTTGVTTNGTAGSSGAYTQIVVDGATADRLFYKCTAHSGMGGGVLEVQGSAIVEFAVTVANVSGNKYHLDGETAASVQLVPGMVYRFDQSDSSNSGHPFRLSTTQDGSHGGGSAYTTSVTTSGNPGSAGAYTQIVVNAATADTLYYYCTAHSGMGGDAVVSVAGSSLSASDTDNLSEGSTNLYFTNARARSAISVTDSGGDGSLAYNSSTGVITYTGPSASEVRAHFSAGTGVTLSSGEISIGQAVGTSNDVQFNDVTVSGDLTVSGTTTSVNSTNTNITDTLIELANGTTGTPSNDAGLVIERGSSDNAFIGFDESADKFIVGTGSFTGASTGNLTISTGTLVANLEGNVTGNVTGTVSSLSNQDTDSLSEGSSNLYYTDARVNSAFDTRLATKTTDNLTEGSSNLYFTNERVDDRVNALLTAGSNISLTYDDASNTLTLASTDTTLSQEQVEDFVGGLITAGTGIGVSYDDSAGTLTISNTASTSTEDVQDIVGAQIATNGSHTGISFTYQDADGDGAIDATVSLSGFSTSDLTEGTNLYYTDARFDTRLATKDTDNLSEGSSNLYYTNTRFDTQLGTKTTDNLTEGSSNLYFTNARADARIAAADIQDLSNVGFSAPGATEDQKVITWDNSAGNFALSSVSGLSGSGETNTASNVGTAGVGVFKGKTGEDLQFKKINAGSAKITITDDTSNDEVDIDFGSVAAGDLSDVTTSGVTNGQALVYSSSNSRFEPGDVTATLSGLTDTTITSPSNGQLIKYNGSAFVNFTADTDDIGEGSTNLYYTDARARGAISITGGSGLAYNSSTGVLDLSSIPNSNLANNSITVTDGSNSTSTALGGTITFSGTSNEVEVAESSGTITVGLPSDTTIGNNLTVTNDLTVSGDTAITGNLTVNGTTTTVNSTTVTVDDPIFTIGGDSAPSSDDNKDRGIEFRYHTGSAAKVGFFGFDDSTGKFTFIPDATNNSEVFSGTAGTIVADLEGSATSLTTSAVTGLTADSSPADDDLILVYDTSATAYKKVTKSNLTGGSGGGLTGSLPYTLADSSSDPIDFLNIGATGTDIDVTLTDGTIDPIQITSSSASATSFTDADTDTKIQVEATTDVDDIRMFTAGTERIRIESDGVVDVKSAKLKINGGSGTNGQALITNGSGGISWGDVATSLAANDLTDVSTSGVASGDSLVYNGSNFVAQRPTNIEDADGDTRVHVEESSDEDKVRIDTGGTERMIIDNNATMSANGGFFIHRTTLASGESFSISANTGTVAAGPLDIEGTVDVAGTLVVV